MFLGALIKVLQLLSDLLPVIMGAGLAPAGLAQGGAEWGVGREPGFFR